MPKLVEVLFNKYIENVYKGQSLEPGQFDELRKCFYAAVYGTLYEVSEVSGKYPEALAMKVLSSMRRECKEIAQDVLDKMYESN